MEDRAVQLRRRIELYRAYLREGLNAAQAVLYLDQLNRDEAELRAIEEAKVKRAAPPAPSAAAGSAAAAPPPRPPRARA